MDKMTDAKIRSWLEKNQPDLLASYRRYETDSLSDRMPTEGAEFRGPESLRTWLEKRHPDILERIPLL
ncbi:MAG: hypothetical protein PVJ53_09325 [Desulfobacterales bacterium]|jgi:hypothetical protein